MLVLFTHLPPTKNNNNKYYKRWEIKGLFSSLFFVLIYIHLNLNSLKFSPFISSNVLYFLQKITKITKSILEKDEETDNVDTQT